MRHDVSGYKKSEGFSPIEPAILWLRPKRCDGVALIALQCVVRRVDKRSASTDPFECVGWISEAHPPIHSRKRKRRE